MVLLDTGGLNSRGFSEEVQLRFQQNAVAPPNETGQTVLAAASQLNPGRRQTPIAQARSYFKITYFDELGKQKVFNFVLMPAIENYLAISASGAKVPELRPGITLQTRMRHRSILVPGSTPVIQTIGPESMTMLLVGLFVGGEQRTAVEPTVQSREVGLPTGVDDAFDISQIFNQEVVLPSIPVWVDVYASAGQEFDLATQSLSSQTVQPFTRIWVRALITSFRICAARENRTYYAMDLLLIDYPQKTRKGPETPEDQKALLQEYETCAQDFEEFRRRQTRYEQDLAAWRAKPNNAQRGAEPAAPSKISARCQTVLKEKNYPGINTVGLTPTTPETGQAQTNQSGGGLADPLTVINRGIRSSALNPANPLNPVNPLNQLNPALKPTPQKPVRPSNPNN